MVVYHTVSYSNKGFFGNPVTCNAAESPCVAGNYVGNDGFDLYREKPGCSGTRSDNIYMNCTLNQVVDETHAEKVYRDFFGTRSEDQYWAIMGNFCSKNPKSKYCERAHYLYYAGESDNASSCNDINTNCKPGYYTTTFGNDDLFVRKPDCLAKDGKFYSGCVLKKVKDTKQAEKIYEDFKNLSLNQEQYNFIMKDYCSKGGSWDYCKDVPTDSIYDNEGPMWLMHLILIAFGIFIGWFWFKDDEDCVTNLSNNEEVSKSNDEDKVSKLSDNEY